MADILIIAINANQLKKWVNTIFDGLATSQSWRSFLLYNTKTCIFSVHLIFRLQYPVRNKMMVD